MKKTIFLTFMLLLFVQFTATKAFSQTSPSNPSTGPEGEADKDLGVKPSEQTLPAPPPETLVQPYPEVEGKAPTPPPSSKPGRSANSSRLAELNLSPEQTKQIIEIRKQFRPDAERRLKEEYLSYKQSLSQAMSDGSTIEQVRNHFENMQKKYSELQTLKFEKLLKIREVLTIEQRKKFAEMRNKSNSQQSPFTE